MTGRPWPAAKVQPCGTNGAYYRHLYYREPPCPPCSAAHTLERDRQAYERYSRYLARWSAISADMRELIGAVALAVTTPPGKETRGNDTRKL
jgi:hypothetical protein